MIGRQPRSTLFPDATRFRSSHGGATAEGQAELIAHYGVTEAAMGCPIRSSMETVHLGEVEGEVPVWFDRNADRKSTRLNSSHANISYAVFCLKKKNNTL